MFKHTFSEFNYLIKLVITLLVISYYLLPTNCKINFCNRSNILHFKTFLVIQVFSITLLTILFFINIHFLFV